MENKFVLYDKSIERVVFSSDDRLVVHEQFWQQIEEHGAKREHLEVLTRKSKKELIY